MKDALATYLHDHLAGATFAVELLEALRDQHASEPVGELAAELLLEIEEDRGVLKMLAERVEGDRQTLKDAVSWLAERASRLKLRREEEGSLGTFESLEGLALGILGKESLWKALAVVAPQDQRLGGVDFENLAARARAQHAKVEAHRLRLAPHVFSAVRQKRASV